MEKISKKSRDELYTIAVDVLSRYDLSDTRIKKFVSSIAKDLQPLIVKSQNNTQKRTLNTDNDFTSNNSVNFAYKQLNSTIQAINLLLQKNNMSVKSTAPDEKLPFFKKILVESLKYVNRDEKLKDVNNKTVIEKFIDRIVPVKRKESGILTTDKVDKLKNVEDINERSQALDFFKNEDSNTKGVSINDFTTTGTTQLKSVITEALDSSNIFKELLKTFKEYKDVLKEGAQANEQGSSGGNSLIENFIRNKTGGIGRGVIRNLGRGASALGRGVSTLGRGALAGARGLVALGGTNVTAAGALPVAATVAGGELIGGQIGKALGSNEAISNMLYGDQNAGKEAYEKYGTGVFGFARATWDLTKQTLETNNSKKALKEKEKELAEINAKREEVIKSKGYNSLKEFGDAVKAGKEAPIKWDKEKKTFIAINKDTTNQTTDNDTINVTGTPRLEKKQEKNDKVVEDRKTEQKKLKEATSTQESTTLKFDNKLSMNAVSEDSKINVPSSSFSAIPPRQSETESIAEPVTATTPASNKTSLKSNLVTEPAVITITKPNPNKTNLKPLPQAEPSIPTQSVEAINSPTTLEKDIQPVVSPLTPEQATPPLPQTLKSEPTSNVKQSDASSTEIFKNIANNTEKTNNQLSILAQAIFKLAETMINSTKIHQTQPVIMGNNNQTTQTPPAAQVAANNYDPIRAMRMKFLT